MAVALREIPDADALGKEVSIEPRGKCVRGRREDR